MTTRSARTITRLGLAWLCLTMVVPHGASAQDVPVPKGTPFPEYAKQIQLPPSVTLAGPADNVLLSTNGLPHVIVTGYWPPTNEMLRPWSQSLAQNPNGWVGENWENRGYNIYAFFPEFPGGFGQGSGDFEVDYQDTSADWWPLLNLIKPIGLITFSRAANDHQWELEGGNRTYATNSWSNDYLTPFKPGPGLPIIDIEPPLTERYSTLPFTAIINAVLNDPTLNDLDPHSTVIDTGAFLSNFIGYHGCWWHFLHSSPTDPMWNASAGHIHVGYAMTLTEAQQATTVTLRTFATHLDSVVLEPRGDMNCDGVVDGDDIAPFTLALTDRPAYSAAYPTCFLRRADVDSDADVDDEDVDPFVALLIGP